MIYVFMQQAVQNCRACPRHTDYEDRRDYIRLQVVGLSRKNSSTFKREDSVLLKRPF